MVSIKLCLLLLLTSSSEGSPDESQDHPEERQYDPDADFFTLTGADKETIEISIMPRNKKKPKWLVIDTCYDKCVYPAPASVVTPTSAPYLTP